VRERRARAGMRSAYKRIDTCAPSSSRPRRTSMARTSASARPTRRRAARPSSSGAARTGSGRGIEFDYLLLPRRLRAPRRGPRDGDDQLQPETVSTDYDTSDRLYFEPLALEDVLAVVDRETRGRRRRLVPRPVRRPDAPEALDGAAQRRRPHSRHLARLDRPRGGPQALRRPARRAADPQPPSGPASSRDEARDVAAAIGFPLSYGLVRPGGTGRWPSCTTPERSTAT